MQLARAGVVGLFHVLNSRICTQQQDFADVPDQIPDPAPRWLSPKRLASWLAPGRIDGGRVVAYSTDASKLGGAIGSVGYGRIVETIDTACACARRDTALRMRAPVIGLWHSGGRG